MAAATDKLRRKRVDLIVANDVSRHDAGFEVDTNEVTLVSAAGAEHVPLQRKAAIATVILDRAEVLVAQALAAAADGSVPTPGPIRRLAKSHSTNSGYARSVSAVIGLLPARSSRPRAVILALP